MVNAVTYATTPATAADEGEIDALLDRTFGIARRTKTSYRLREGNSPVPGLSRVVREPALGIVGAISFWPLAIGPARTKALLLGPLAVHPERQSRGIGLLLMREGLASAAGMGHRLVLLVGDAPYYARVGFAPIDDESILLPGPVDRRRFLALELVPGALQGVSGMVLPANRA